MRLFTFALMFSVMASVAAAQDHQGATTDPNVDPDRDTPTVQPDALLHLEQMMRYDSPQSAVRRKAELRSAQRRQRLAMQKWYGYSPSRPPSSPVPWMGSYAPVVYRWVGPFRVVVPLESYRTAARR